MNEKEQFIKWLKEISRWNRVDLFVKHIEESGINGDAWASRVEIFTNIYKYTINAKILEDHTYLGCTVSKRMAEAGETWTRGNDLPDGSFTQKTWDKIKNSIIQNELVVVKPIQRKGVKEEIK